MPRVTFDDGVLIPYRSGIEEADSPNTPTSWAANPGGYNNAEIIFHGVTWPDGLKFWPTFWCRNTGDSGAATDPQTLTPFAKDDPVLEDVGTVAYAAEYMTDDGQTFSSIRPTAAGDPSDYAVIAYPASTDDPAFFGWPDSNSIPPALAIRPTHFGDPDEDTDEDGWVGDRTPDGTVTAYAIRPPDIKKRFILEDLAGSDVAVTIGQVDGLPAETAGYFALDIGVRFF